MSVSSKLRVLFCHGMGGKVPDQMSNAIETWSRSFKIGFDCVSYRNYGNPEYIWNVNDWRDDIISAIDESAQLHHQSPLVVGHSAACQAVLRAAIARNNLVHGLVLFSPGTGLGLDYMDRAMPGSVRLLKQGEIINHPAIDPKLVVRVDLPNLMEFVKNCPTKPDTPIPIHCPIRIVHGLKDRLVPYTNSLKLLSLLESQQKSLVLINDGHFIVDESVVHEALTGLWRSISSCETKESTKTVRTSSN